MKPRLNIQDSERFYWQPLFFFVVVLLASVKSSQQLDCVERKLHLYCVDLVNICWRLWPVEDHCWPARQHVQVAERPGRIQRGAGAWRGARWTLHGRWAVRRWPWPGPLRPRSRLGRPRRHTTGRARLDGGLARRQLRPTGVSRLRGTAA